MLQAMTVAVVGLGKIGLPLAAQFASKGLQVIGCDVLPEVVNAINGGHSHIHQEPGLEDAVAAAVRDGRLSATLDTTAAAQQAGVIVVIVPLMVGLDGSIDFRSIDAATAAIARGLQGGALVIYETTLPVGTTQHRLGPMLEKESGLRAGAGFLLAFSPERLYAGRIFEAGNVADPGIGSWTSTYSSANSRYEITLSGVNYSIDTHAVFVTPIFCTGVSAVTYRVDGSSGKIVVYFYKAVDQTAAQCQFHFQVIEI